MALFAIADTHLSLGTNKPMDIFKGWDNYTERLKSEWERLVAPDDVVVIAGDISWAMGLSQAHKDFEFLHRLPGKKLILKGNHDYWWTTRRKMESFFSQNGFDSLEIIHNNAFIYADRYAICGTRGWFYDAEEDADKKIMAREVGRLTFSIEEGLKNGHKPLVFLHYPPVIGDSVCEEFVEVLIKYNVKECYYGHIHGNLATQLAASKVQIYKGIEFRIISCDALNFSPLLIKG